MRLPILTLHIGELAAMPPERENRKLLLELPV